LTGCEFLQTRKLEFDVARTAVVAVRGFFSGPWKNRGPQIRGSALLYALEEFARGFVAGVSGEPGIEQAFCL